MRVSYHGGRYVCSGRVDKSPKKVNRSTLDSSITKYICVMNLFYLSKLPKFRAEKTSRQSFEKLKTFFRRQLRSNGLLKTKTILE